MCTQQLVLKQRSELIGALCRGGSSEPLDCVLDWLLSWDVLIWEEYQNIRGLSKPLSAKCRDLLDLVYVKGEEACSHLLVALDQILPEAQKSGLSLGKGNLGKLEPRTPSNASQTLLTDRPALVRKIRDQLDGVLDALMESNCFTSADCDEVLLPVYTPSQKVRKLLDQVRFKGENAANVVLQYLHRNHVKSVSARKEKQLPEECLLYRSKLCSSVSAQSHFLSTYGGTGRFSLDDIYTDGVLEVQSDKQTLTLQLPDVVGLAGTLNKDADTILVSGEAGTGKSTLLQRLHLLWARGNLLPEVLLLFPFSCRKLNAEQRALSLKDLLFLHCCWPDRGQDLIFQFILDHPDSVLFTFDGLDEFRQRFTDEERLCCPTQQAPVSTLLLNLLQGTLMKGVTKVVTSRPESVGPVLKQCLRKEVLLKGFSPAGIDHFVRRHHDDANVATRVVESLKANTALLGLCHIPVFCWIVSKCYKELLGCGEGTPRTVTDVYLMVLKHFFQKKTPQEQQCLGGKGWLQEHHATVMRLGKLALEGLETSCYVFAEAELQKCGITGSDVNLGFLVQCNDLSDSSDCKRFEFLHVTLQCFFASLNIVLKTKSSRSVILKLFKQSQALNQVCLGPCLNGPGAHDPSEAETQNLQITANFVAGLLSQHHRSLLLQCCPAATLKHKSKQVTKCLSKGIQRHFRSIPQPVEGEKKSMHAMPSFVWLIKCIYEMQESDIARGAVARLEVEHLKLTYCNIGPVECTALAYVLKHLRHSVGIQLDFNTVGDVGLEQLLPCLHVCHSLYLRHNNISDDGIQKLVKKAVLCESFKKVALFNNRLTDDCTKHFAWLLQTKNFLALRLGNNNITSEGAQQLAEGLRYNKTLQYLGLWGNRIEDKGTEALADALKESTSLIWLSLVENGVGTAGACALAELVRKCTTLTELWLNQNCIGRDGVECLIKALKENTTVKEVWLRGNNLSPEDELELRQQESRLVF